MNPISPQQFEAHVNERRRNLISELTAERTRRAASGRDGRLDDPAVHRARWRRRVISGRLLHRRRPAAIAVTALFGAVALVSVALLDADAATAKPTPTDWSAADAMSAAPDCVAPTTSGDRQPNLHPRIHRQRDRLDPIAV